MPHHTRRENREAQAPEQPCRLRVGVGSQWLHLQMTRRLKTEDRVAQRPIPHGTAAEYSVEAPTSQRRGRVAPQVIEVERQETTPPSVQRDQGLLHVVIVVRT